MTERWSTAQVAQRLGVRPETVYAYVSRGLLSSERVPGGRGSTFDPEQVRALLSRQRRGRPGPSRASSGPVVDTAITLIEDGRLYFRGVDVIELAAAYSVEPVASWLWTGAFEPVRFLAPPETVAVARAAAAALPDGAELMARLRVAVAAAGSADPLRYDVRPAAVVPMARGLIATMVDALLVADGAEAGPNPDSDALAQRLWRRLSPVPATDVLLGCLDSALVLLLDHDLAVSTVAARTAASVRANPYAVVGTGLSALEGPLHGGASRLAFAALQDALQRDARTVVAEHLRADRLVPGFGHRLYPDGDPRARALLDRLRLEPFAEPVMAAADAVVRASGLLPNVDFALAALALAAGMPRDAGEVIFAVARSVGWVAHALEEYEEPPLRFRGHGVYRGPAPRSAAAAARAIDLTVSK